MRLVLDARTAAFAALIDYAGVFPPASRALPDAVEEYRSLRSGTRSWVAGRFLCRASQLTDLAAILMSSFSEGEQPWEVGVVFDLPIGESAAAALDFQTEMDPAVTIGAAEAKPHPQERSTIEGYIDAMLPIAPEVVPFLEVDRHVDITDQVAAIARSLNARNRVGGAKLRCGGLSETDFPTTADVAEFIVATTNHKLPFKATAGLHQPIRHLDADLGVHRHGFVNLLIATALAEEGADRQSVEDAVAETDPEAFNVSAAFASWRDHRIPGSTIRRTRTMGFIAYGSCDFDEPIEALEELDFLGGGT